MIEITIDKDDLSRLHEKLAAVSPEKARGAFKTAMQAACEKVRSMLIMNLSGKIVKVRTGHLRRSIQYMVRDDMNGIVGVVGSGVGICQPVVYDEYLEKGTRYMKARRHKKITADEAQKIVPALFLKFLKRQLSK